MLFLGGTFEKFENHSSTRFKFMVLPAMCSCCLCAGSMQELQYMKQEMIRIWEEALQNAYLYTFSNVIHERLTLFHVCVDPSVVWERIRCQSWCSPLSGWRDL